MVTTPRILMASFLSYPLEGGAERQGWLLARTMRALGVEVDYVAARLPGMPAYEVRDEVPIHRVFCAPWAKYIRQVTFNAVYPFTLSAFLLQRGKDYDIFHCHGAFDISAAPLIALGRLARRTVLIKHSSMNDHAFLRRAAIGRLVQPLLPFATAFVGNSPAVYNVMLNKHRLPPGSCFCIPNGTPLRSPRDRAEARAALGLSTSDPIVVCVANFGPDKNQIGAIRAWPIVVREHPRARLLLVGAGARLAECREEARRLGQGEHILFAGRQPSVDNYLDAADLFLFPSASEGMSNALMEAMASGLPCAVSDIPGNHMLVDPETESIMFDPEDTQDIARGVLSLLNNRVRAKQLGIAARERIARTFSMEIVAEQYIRLYKYLQRSPDTSVEDLQPLHKAN